ncbi:MAG: IS630 family transposase [Spirochaetaceae bacterium]|jgi:transposase|nr:IS630 family transposase [Spirochaetaceae bacterium]
MKGKTCRVHLTEDEQRRLEDTVAKGVHPAREITRARILLLLNEGTDREGKPVKVLEQTGIAERCRCSGSLVYIVSKQYEKEGLERVVNRKKRETPPVPAKVTGEAEAKIIALSCSEPPPGYSRWTLRLLEEKSKAVIGIELSDTAIGTVLKKTPLKPHQKECRRIPPKQNAAFVANMEDVLEAYQRPYDEKRPVIRMDEQPVQLLGEARDPVPMNERHRKREDSEYVRKGTCSVFMFVEPLGGRRYVSASRRRTRQDRAREAKSIVTEEYPEAEKAVPAMDNLNTRTIPSLYQTFPAEEAFRIAQKLEIHYTPRHGSWLNIAEIEPSAMASQCLDRRIGTMEKLSGELEAWQTERNEKRNPVKWQFRTEGARIKLHSLYPIL